MDKDDPKKFNISSAQVWPILAFIPLIVILVSFILGGWSWGLMDDYKFMNIPGNILQRIMSVFPTSISTGRVVPVYYVHAAIFYKIFAYSPTAFYIFRWVECVFALGLWALLASRVTRSQFAAPLFLLVALSFYKTYDAVFFLSTNEILGVLFFGLSATFFLNAFEQRLENGGRVRKWPFLFGIFFLLLAVGCKEPFFAVMAALGGGSIVVSFIHRKKGLMGFGIASLLTAIGYAIFLRVLVVKDYSATYASINFNVIGQNILVWVRNDLAYHTPWILLAAILMIFVKSSSLKRWTATRLWMFMVGSIAYIAYVLILLPWSTWGHYATPLGIFFAFTIAVLLADRVEALRPAHFIALAVGSFVFALVVSASALRFHSVYQYDTANLMKWLATNSLFEHEMALGAVVRGNAWEPCETIVAQVNGIYGKGYKNFVFTPNVREILADPRTRYYLWGPKWGDQDLSRLGEMWTPMFVSDHWVLFRRMN